MKNKNVCVLGAGQMGAGIAQVFAQAGYSVRLYDAFESAQEKALAGVKKSLDKLASKEKLKEKPDEIFARLSFTADIKNLKDFDPALIVEAVPENFDLKAKLFKALDESLAADVFFASNTSSISITRLAAVTKRPELFAGMHFMNPVPLMALVEMIKGMATSDQTFATMIEVAKKLGKTPVKAKDRPGFVVNRILIPMINEAFFALEEGLASAEDIDAGMKLGTNQPMGPLALADFVGLDTVLYIAEILHNELGEDKYRPSTLLRKYVEAGWFGRKSGRGVYRYDS